MRRAHNKIMQGITYRVQAVNPETFKTIEQVFTTSDAALRVRDYLRGKGYTAAVRPKLST